LLQKQRGQELDVRHGRWWFVYLLGLLALGELSGPGRIIPGGELSQLVLVGAFALAIFPFAVAARLQQASPHAQVICD
jgi:hypothetical protein